VSETLIQVLMGTVVFGLGMVVGALLQRYFLGDGDKARRLEQKLAQTQEQQQRYQADVNAHFMETAKLVRTLNRSYRDVHAQLVKGASRLCDSDQADEFMGISFDADGRNKRTINHDDDTPIAPPMDYAPKQGPEEEGTLSESFGLKNDRSEDEELLQDVPPPRL
jgi:uncharacterized membrane-anchored protein YhcB (DUF1043 family)